MEIMEIVLLFGLLLKMTYQIPFIALVLLFLILKDLIMLFMLEYFVPY